MAATDERKVNASAPKFFAHRSLSNKSAMNDKPFQALANLLVCASGGVSYVKVLRAACHDHLRLRGPSRY